MKKISKRTARKRNNKLRRALIAAGCSSGVLGSGSVLAAQLPVPCVAGNCGKGPSVWVTSGNASATITANTLQVQQTTNNAILNWSSFNVSSDGHVVFQQPNSSSIALNRIFQGSPSAIFGSVTANGQLYLVNTNGFVFGSTSRVNVGGLLATSLNISDDTFNSGLLTPVQNQQPALTAVTAQDGTVLSGDVLVQQGAQLATNGVGQRLMLAAPTVTNGGSISAPDGQAILAAGTEVYLYTDPKSPIRGLLVEVNGGGKTINQVTGSISADRGDVTLIGLAVNQDGRVSATTSIAANGSIRLLARDSNPPSTAPGATPVFGSQTGGTLELGPQSVTAALPDPTDTATAVNAVQQVLPTIELSAQQVTLTGGSHIVSPDGQLTISARANPGATSVSSASPDPNARIRMDAGAVIDLTGSEATVPVTNNLVTVQLRGTELADDPLQRNGPLRGQTVVVDARADGGNGTPLANVSGEIGLIQHNILERTDNGGTVTFDSSGDIGVAAGAVVNVSGGAVNYTGGVVQTTQLVKSDGSTVDIGNADPNQNYTGIVNPTFKSVSNTWGVINFIPTPGIAHYEAGYTQGASAGSVQFLAPGMVLNGTFLGEAVNGPLQRPGSSMALGGQFIIGSSAAQVAQAVQNGSSIDFRAPAVELTSNVPNIAFADDASLPNGLTLQLPVDFLTNGGFSRVQIASNQRIILPENTPVTLQPDGSFSLTAPRIDVSSSVTVPAGQISLTTSTPSPSSVTASGVAPGIYVGDSVRFDVNGLWTNDSLVAPSLQPTGTVLPNAGSIALSQTLPGGTLDIGSNVQFSATGGAWLNRSGALTTGTGGSISLLSDIAAGGPGTFTVGDNVGVAAFGVQGALGGSLEIEAPRIDISSGDTTWLRAQSVSSESASGTVLRLDSSLFSNFGFSSFNLIADGEGFASFDGRVNALTVEPNSTIDLSTRTLQLNADAAAHASANDLTPYTHSVLLPAFQRTPSQLTLNASASNVGASDGQVGGLLIGTNAHIVADPNPTSSGRQSSVTLSSVGSLELDGVIDVPSGSVSLAIATPPTIIDPGFSPGLQLQLGPTARIDVSGTTVYTPSDLGLLLGNVLPGGSVTLEAARGTIVTDPGSLIDFSGTQALVDLQTTLPTPSDTRATVASAGGSLSVSAGESISLLGDFKGAAGTGTTGKADGGTLDITLFGLQSGAPGAQPFPPYPLTIQLTSNGGQLEPSNANRAVLDPNKIASSGVDSLTLDTVGNIEFSAGVNLTRGRSIVLDSPAIVVDAGAPVSVSAPYLALVGVGGSSSGSSAQPGAATISFSGEQVDLMGNLSLDGVGNALISSTGDIQLLGAWLAGTPSSNGSLSVGGDLTLSAARVVPGTASNFTINANSGAGNTVTFQQAGTANGTPLSVAGSLTVNAQNIVQDGTIMAPFGTVTLNASQSLTLAPGSTTSVSGNGATLPYGLVENDTTWFYGPNANTLMTVTGAPQRQITLNGASVTLAKGSTVDVSGGGDLYGYEWTPGTGGTTDALAATQNPNLYAIIPSLGSRFAPYDPLMYAGSNLQPGASVYLSGGGGLAAGIYALLPARYALLPGAYLVEAVPGFANLTPGATVTTPNGASVVAGYRTFADTGLGGTQYSGFEILPGNYAYQLASYTDEYASQFFSGQGNSAATTPTTPPPALPADAGTLVLAVNQSLDALGTILGKGAKGGENATIAVAAPQIEIDPGIAASQQLGDIHLSAAAISSWNAGRLFIGATPIVIPATPTTAAAKGLQVGTDVIRVENGATLSADEVVLVAKQGINIDGGASITSSSASDRVPPSTPGLGTPTPLNLTGNGASGAALVAVSDLNAYVPVRPADTPATTASVVIAQGAQVASLGALSIDAPAGAQIADGSLSGAGAHWSLGADQVVFGAAGSTPSALTVDASLISALSIASSVRITGQSSIALDAPVNLAGSATNPIQEISLLTPSLIASAGSPTAGTALSSSFNASKIVLGGGVTPAASNANSGASSSSASVTFAGDEIDVGPGTLTMSGFSQTTLQANGAVVGTGTGTLLVTSGNLEVASRLLTTADGATTTISASGSGAQLQLQSVPSGSPVPAALPNPGLGGSLTLTAAMVSDQAAILMPSGDVTLNASQQLALQSGASINVAGVTPSYAAGSHGSPGGNVTLQSGGDLTMASGASISVAAAPVADAGRIDVTTVGNATLAGSFAGSADPGNQGGTFTVEAGTLTGFNVLNQQLELGGFAQERDFRVNSGDLQLQAGAVITAHDVTLTADSGSVTVDGTINASAADERGSISLNAGNNIVVSATGQLIANGTEATSRGGSIDIFSKGGIVNLEQGSTIEASGANSTGQLVIRAPQLAAQNNIGLSVATDLSRVDSVLVEPIIEATVSNAPTQGEVAGIIDAAAAWLSAAAPNILQQQPLQASNVALRPYVDMSTSGDLLLGSLDLDKITFGGQAVHADVAFRTSGNLTVTGTLSDGFKAVQPAPRKPTYVDLDCASSTSCPSGSITLVAGADLNAAAPASVISGAAADLTLTGGSIVRTATGDIQLASARDINIGDVSSSQATAIVNGNLTNSQDLSANASIYTGGVAAPAKVDNVSREATSYPFGDSHISLAAGRDITGVPIVQSVSAWQHRTATASDPTTATWGVSFSQFNWNVGALGGGDVSIQAGRNANNVSAAVIDSAVLKPGAALDVSGGGNLFLRADGDIGSAYLYVADGTGRVQAGGSLNSARDLPSSSIPVGSLLVSGDASFSLVARGDVELGGEIQASLLGFPVAGSTDTNFPTYFFRYGPGSALQATSRGGSIAVDQAGTTETAYFENSVNSNVPSPSIVAPTLDLASYAGNVNLAQLELFPSTNGQISIVAAQDIMGGDQRLLMSDVSLSLLPTATSLLGGVTSGPDATTLLESSARSDLHQNDPTPVFISAANDISQLAVSLPKATTIEAGRDIQALTFLGQNLNPTDTTLISAGRNITYSSDPASTDATSSIMLGGPGRLEMLAGGNIDLGVSTGVTTVGNLRNDNLPAGGADILMLAGQGAPLGVDTNTSGTHNDFVSTIIGASPAYQQELQSYVDNLTGKANLSFDDAANDFRGLSEAQQLPLLSDVFFNELVISGREANTVPNSHFARGYAAIDALFPESRGPGSPYSGDLTLNLSRIYTLDGGSISLLVPGGSVNVGLSVLPPTFAQANLVRTPADLGIVAVQSGNVDIYSLGSVLVNSSHIFTLGGGNIAIWSTLGNIDAGRGSKTSVSAPPPTISIDPVSGVVTLNFTNTVAGNGIQTISTGPGGTGGQVDLDAPVGFVNAGDAGISAAGSANIAAERVLGVDNIQVGGTATGIPPETSGISASLSGASAVASSSTVASNAAVPQPSAATAQQAPLAQNALSWLDVFVEGFGEEGCKANDAECLKREQAHPK